MPAETSRSTPYRIISWCQPSPVGEGWTVMQQDFNQLASTLAAAPMCINFSTMIGRKTNLGVNYLIRETTIRHSLPGGTRAAQRGTHEREANDLSAPAAS
jgi:hypothetical protein